jgi:hypothetical protein
MPVKLPLAGCYFYCKLRQILLFLSFSGDVAQLGERVVRNDEVEGSIPFFSTTLISKKRPLGRFLLIKAQGYLTMLKRAKHRQYPQRAKHKRQCLGGEHAALAGGAFGGEQAQAV